MTNNSARERAEKSDPIELMYKTILGISFVAGPHSLYQTAESALARVRFLADQALKTMNTEHTKKVQRAIGLLR